MNLTSVQLCGKSLWRYFFLFVYLACCLSASRSQKMWLFACSVSFCKPLASIKKTKKTTTSDLFYMPCNLSMSRIHTVYVHVHLWLHIFFLSAEAISLVNLGFIVVCVVVWRCFAQHLVNCTVDAISNQTGCTSAFIANLSAFKLLLWKVLCCFLEKDGEDYTTTTAYTHFWLACRCPLKSFNRTP